METYELLDRFEVLYPTKSKISDLRRAYIDKDLSSIFRLLPNEVNGNIDDLRKAVIEKNLHSLFRLIDDEDLGKFLVNDNLWKLWPILERYVDTYFVTAFKNLNVNNIEYDKDCFSRGQLLSKQWLVKELRNIKYDLGTVFLCAGWYATLSTMLFEGDFKINKVRSFDVDPSCEKIAEIFNKKWYTDGWKFKAITEDIMNIDYNEHHWQTWSSKHNRMSKPIIDKPDTIINTSCEHLPDFISWYSKLPISKLIVLQANNYHDVDEHVNTYNTLEEFSASAPMSTILYQGELELPKYKRFMKIGYK